MRPKGRKPKTHDSRDFLLSEHLAALPPVKIPFGHGCTYTNWEMLANGPDPSAPPGAREGVGDCVAREGDSEGNRKLATAKFLEGPYGFKRSLCVAMKNNAGRARTHHIERDFLRVLYHQIKLKISGQNVGDFLYGSFRPTNKRIICG